MKLFLIIFSSLFCTVSLAQTFTGTGGAIPGTSTTQTCFNTAVTGVGAINNTYGLAQVCININHPYDEELEILLSAPDGTTVPLSVQNGFDGDNYTSTCFSANATIPIKFGTAPFTGSFLPEGHLGAVNNGQNANGTWKLCIQDRRTGANAGNLVNWSLTFSNTPAPQPPALPACAQTLPTNSSCASAAAVCDFNGLCGTTSGSTIQDWPGSGLDACFGLQNNSFIKFVAAAPTASFSVWVPTNTSSSFESGGIQMIFFSGTCGSGAVTSYGCYPHIFPYSAGGRPLITVVSASGLTPGNTYYLMIDGFNNDNCTFTIAANTGVNILDITPASAIICNGNSVSLTASGGNGMFTWSPPTGLNTTSGTTVIASPTLTTTYTATSTLGGFCPITKDVLVTVNQPPAAPSASVSAQPTCAVQTGTISITAPLGANLQYSINGTAFQAGTLFTTLAPGNYPVSVKDMSTGCVSAITSLTVNAAPAPAPPATASVTVQPTCIITTGTISITAPIGANYEYSINGSTYQPGTLFTGVTPGTYDVTVRNISSGCVSTAIQVTVNNIPAPPATATASVTAQPTCITVTGTITITSPTGTGLEYSINGTTYQPGTIFTGLAPGNYNVTVKEISTGCVSAALLLTVNNVPAPPVAPTANITVQPTCSTPTGTISISAPTGTGLEYNIDGSAYQASTTIAGVSPGNHSITVMNTSTGCVSAATSITVNNIPLPPSTPVASVTVQPTCTTPTATVVVTAPLGASLVYSINGTTYQSGTTFTGIIPGAHNITVQNSSTGCISAALQVTVNNLPAPPPAPSASVTVQPTCSTPTGTITISTPTGAALEYSINGTVYQPGTLFSSVAPGNYNITVKDLSTGCISASTPVTINPVPVISNPPTVTTSGPGCTGNTASITVTAPAGAAYQYSIDGTNYQASNIFPGLSISTPTIFPVSVKDINTGCVSPVLQVPFSPNPGITGKPGLQVIQPTCTVADGMATVITPVGINIEYSLNAGVYQSSPVFTGLTAGNYQVVARYKGFNCPSEPASFTITKPDQATCDENIYFPSAFSPNGDGNNDEFGALGNLNIISTFELKIYNRYGELVFQTTSPFQKWDGKYKGKKAGNHVFAWHATYSTVRGITDFQKGTLIIVR